MWGLPKRSARSCAPPTGSTCSAAPSSTGAVGNLGSAGSAQLPTEGVLLEVVRELGADYLLAGAFQQLGDRLRLTARLIDAQSETAVEAFKVDGRQGDLFEVAGSTDA